MLQCSCNDILRKVWAEKDAFTVLGGLYISKSKVKGLKFRLKWSNLSVISKDDDLYGPGMIMSHEVNKKVKGIKLNWKTFFLGKKK